MSACTNDKRPRVGLFSLMTNLPPRMPVCDTEGGGGQTNRPRIALCPIPNGMYLLSFQGMN